MKTKSDAMYLLSHVRVAAIIQGDKLSKTIKASIYPRESVTEFLQKRV